MSVLTNARPVSRAAFRTGVVLTVLIALFLLFDAVTKLLSLPDVVTATEQMGFSAAAVPVIGGVLLVCLALYLVPRTSILGAVLLTGYLGGAVCAQLRIDAPLFSTMLFPVYFGVLVWVALYLRSAPLRALVANSVS
ncbi:MAG TPA: DoxX family protein [Pseudonocardia sp.]